MFCGSLRKLLRKQYNFNVNNKIKINKIFYKNIYVIINY